MGENTDMGPEVAKELVKQNKDYAKEMAAKMKRRKKGEANDSDEDFVPPTSDEVKEMMEMSMKLKRQKKAAAEQAEMQAELDCTNCTATETGEKPVSELTDEEKE